MCEALWNTYISDNCFNIVPVGRNVLAGKMPYLNAIENLP